MKITIFTGNQPRHLSLVKALSSSADECYAIMEGNTVFPGAVPGFFKKSDTFREYFSHVLDAEKKIFGPISFLDTVKSLHLHSGDLSLVDRSVLAPALNSDIYVVFGSSYIKGWLIDELIENKAVNIHMGISPYYRGSSCNFWALYDRRPELVGSTIHLLSKGLDSGRMIRHVRATADGCDNGFEYTMNVVKTTQEALKSDIISGKIFDYEPVKQDKNLELRYTRNSDFSDDVAREYLNNPMQIDEIKSRLEKMSDDQYSFLRA